MHLQHKHDSRYEQQFGNVRSLIRSIGQTESCKNRSAIPLVWERTVMPRGSRDTSVRDRHDWWPFSGRQVENRVWKRRNHAVKKGNWVSS